MKNAIISGSFALLFALLKVSLVGVLSGEMYENLAAYMGIAGFYLSLGPSAHMRNHPSGFDGTLRIDRRILFFGMALLLFVVWVLNISRIIDWLLLSVILCLTLLYDVFTQFAVLSRKVILLVFTEALLLLFYVWLFFGFSLVYYALILLLVLFIALAKMSILFESFRSDILDKVIGVFAGSTGVFLLPMLLVFLLDGTNQWIIASFYVYNLFANMNILIVSRLMYSGVSIRILQLAIPFALFIEFILLYILMGLEYFREITGGEVMLPLYAGCFLIFTRTFYSFFFTAIRIGSIKKKTKQIEILKVLAQSLVLWLFPSHTAMTILISLFGPILLSGIIYLIMYEKYSALHFKE